MPSIRRWLLISIVGLTVLCLAHGMALIYIIKSGISLWFPPSGIAVALTLWFGLRGIILTGIASFLMSPFWGLHGWEQILAFSDIIEPVSAWLVYRRICRGSLTLNSLRDATFFTLSIPLLSSGVLALVGSLGWVAIGKMPESKLVQSISYWWLGNAIGIMAITPTALLVITPYLQRWGWLSHSEPLDSSNSINLSSRYIVWELGTILLLCLATAILTVSESHRTGFQFQQLSFLSFIPILWAATRFGVTNGMLVSSFCIIVTLFAYFITYPRAIILSSLPVQAEVLHIHKLSLLVQCAVGLLVGTAITERANTQVTLAVQQVKLGEYQARAQLSEQLIKLNSSLEQANARLEESNREKDELLSSEQKLRRRLSNILESMSDAFIAVNNEWKITYVNQQAAKINRVEPEQLINKNHWELWSDAKGTKFELEYNRALTQGIPVHFEVLYEPFNKWFEIHAYPFEDGLGIFFRDISDRKQTEAEREQLLIREKAARNEAEIANRLKDDFLAVLSHELRTPLNPILGWSDLLQKRQFDQATLMHGLATIERNAKLQTQLIEDLLDISRIIQGKMVLNMQPVNLIKTVEAALETMRLAAEAKNIQIQTTLDVNIGQVSGDAARLQQIFWNLLANAVKFTSIGGRVEVRLDQCENFAKFQVKDTGKGISAEFLPHIFEYFRQADSTTTRQFGGLGLGLAIVRHLTELHGGYVQADSQGEEMGATFTVSLPLISSVIQKDTDTTTLLNNCVNFQGLYILVVDDEADTRSFLKFMLEMLGVTVSTVASAIEALEVLANSKPDLILSDIGMPEMNGYQFMEKIRGLPTEQGGKIPAIAMTAYAGEINRQQALAAGYQMHLSKPVEIKELLKAIEQTLKITQ